MKTLKLTPSAEDLDRASELIRAGGLVAVPTETVYGLACNGLDAAAVERIYEVKGRPPVKPLSLMVPGPAEMDRYCVEVSDEARRLGALYWPGPLTIVMEAGEPVPEIVRAGGRTVGLRCPDHPATLALLEKVGVPLAAPSANPSGRPSPKTAEEVLFWFDGIIDAVIDGGPCTLGVESTVIDLSEGKREILREGAVSRRALSR